MNKFNQITSHGGELGEDVTLEVGAGVTWGDVYKYLEAHHPDRAVIGGDPRVGVAGWLLGGGYSLITNMHGLGIDNIGGFRVFVPSDRTFRNANDRENPELFWALKV